MADAVYGAGATDLRGLGTTTVPTAPPLNSTTPTTTYEASRLVKEQPGICYGASGYNSKVSAQFILIFDSRGVPAAAQSPAVVITVLATANWSYNPGVYGRAFTAGIYFANSSTAPNLTAGSADVWFDVQYR